VEKHSFSFFLVILAPICGWFIRDFAQSKKSQLHFENVLDELSAQSTSIKDSKWKVSSAFYHLSNNDKVESISIIFNKLYNDSLQSRCQFLNDYNEYDLSFISHIKETVGKDLSKIYKSIDNKMINLNGHPFRT